MVECQSRRVGLLMLVALVAGPAPAAALVPTAPDLTWPGAVAIAWQSPDVASPSLPGPEEVTWVNERDGTRLRGTLVVPSDGGGPRPGVVVHSIAGTDRLVDRLVGEGYAVLLPVRRGFVEVEPLLRATYDDLGSDIESAIRYLESRPEVDQGAVALIAQGDDAPPALVSAATSPVPVPMIVLGPPASGGVETFRREQRSLAERGGASAEELTALDGYIDGIADIVLNEDGTFTRVYRLQALRAGSPVQLPGNAAFPGDERQAWFFASALWHDRLAFEPVPALGRLRSPVLVVLGLDDPNASAADWLDSVEAGLSESDSDDASACLVPGRTRHVFTDDAIETIVEWLDARAGPDRLRSGGAVAPSRAGRPSTCLDGVPGR